MYNVHIMHIKLFKLCFKYFKTFCKIDLGAKLADEVY